MTLDLETYSRRVLDLYSRLPDTPPGPRRADRKLVIQLHVRSVDIVTIESALLLATARRLCRPPDRPPLPPVRSLAYYLPVLDELLQHPLPNGYTDYLRSKVHL
ncbi:MAG: hypothetical protein O3C10_13040 [Chloroflexi bacterium]|nr:hypothetical protein [Chloroflexota bacterium]